MEYDVGDLIRVLVNVDLMDGTALKVGDVGIVLSNESIGLNNHFTDFDYIICVNSALVYVFQDEIESYT